MVRLYIPDSERFCFRGWNRVKSMSRDDVDNIVRVFFVLVVCGGVGVLIWYILDDICSPGPYEKVHCPLAYCKNMGYEDAIVGGRKCFE